jgi:exosortase J
LTEASQSHASVKGILFALPPGRVILATVLTVAGSLALLPLWLHIARIWWSDPLRVIGAAFPPIALLGVMAAWRRLHWVMAGSLWGLVPIVIAVQLAKYVNVAPYANVTQSVYWAQIHMGPVLFLYGAGAVVLFGGWGLLRRASLPLCLLLCVNPVPGSFNVAFDLPLQELSANTARAFAHLIGLHPTGEQLKMMFSPDFGMLIVPGCNGVRGSITLAYLALIYGYTRRLRPAVLLGAGFAALLIGYGMNLLRLCLLVVYYRVGLSVTSIQPYGAGVDYAIGCTVFLLGTMALGFMIRSLEPPPEAAALSADQTQPAKIALPSKLFAVSVLCLLVVTGVSLVQERALFSPKAWAEPNETEMLDDLPRSVGAFTLVRSYTEHQYSTGGKPILVLGEYAGPVGQDGQAAHVTLGLYVASGYHRVIDSKVVRGLRPLSTGAFDAASAKGIPVALGTSLYDDGISQEFNAETNCTASSCENPMVTYQRFRVSDYLTSASGNRLPIVFRMEWPHDDETPSQVLHSRFQATVQEFIRGLDMQALVAHAGHPLD